MATWTDADFERLRDEIGNFGVCDVVLYPNTPPVRMRLNRMEVLAMVPVLGNPLIAEIMERGGALPALPSGPDISPEERWANTLNRYDAVIGAMVLDPPWVYLVDLPKDEDGRPKTRVAGKMCLYDIPDWDTRMILFDIATGGADRERLREFREQCLGRVARPDSASVPDAPEPVRPEPVSAEQPGSPAPAVVRRRDLPAGRSGAEGGAGEGGPARRAG